MALEDNLKKLNALLAGMETNHLTREEFLPAFQKVVEAVKQTRDMIAQENTANKNELVALIDERLRVAESMMEKKHDVILSRLDSAEKTWKSDSRTIMRLIEQNTADIKAEMTEEYDDAEIRSMIQSIKDSIPEMPKEFDPTAIMEEIKTLEERFKELDDKIIRAGRGVGGVTNLRIQQAFKYILKTEAPVGLINGSNTTYRLSQPIFAILSMSINGETIAQLPNYTIKGNTFIFSSALPADYSGKDFEVKFV